MKHVTTDKLLSLGMALHADKRTMEHRVRSIFARRHSAWFASLAAVVLCGMIGVLGFTTACQPAEAAEVAPTEIAVLDVADLGKETQTTETDRIYDLSEIPSDSYSILIDAEVQIPKADGWFVTTVQPTPFSQELVDRVVKYFFEGATFYAPAQMTKQEIADKMAVIREELTTMEKDSDDWDSAEDALKELEAAYADAPETVEKTPVSPVFQPQEGIDAEEIGLYADMGFTQPSWLNVINLRYANHWNLLTVHLDRDNLFLPILPQPMDTSIFSKEDAQAYAEEALQAMDIQGFTLASVAEGYAEESGEYGYVLEYRRSIEGLPVTMGYIPNYSSAPYRWNSDSITFRVGEQGITAFEWDEYSALETQTEAVEVLSLESVLPTAKQALADACSRSRVEVPYAEGSRTATVDRIVLEYRCMADSRTTEPSQIIPTWGFYGDILVKGADGTAWQYEGRKDICLVAINALDGNCIRAEGESVELLPEV